MSRFTRRNFIKTGVGVTAGAVLGVDLLLDRASVRAREMPFQPEQGARLRMLRWNRFVESEDIQFDNNIAAFQQATGIEVRLDKEFLDDIQPKAAVAANVGKGPDVIWGPMAIPHLIPEKLLNISDVAHYLGEKYGGWYEVPAQYCIRDNIWIALPLCVSGNYINYRSSWLQQAGYDVFPQTTGKLLEASKELKKSGHPGGMALGHATGDGNAWTHWLIWAFGGRMVDEQGKVTINSAQTGDALEYIRELYPTWIRGTASWNDSNNNKAFLAGDISYTNNGISIYQAALRENMSEIAEDMNHAHYPIGPVGKPTELQLPFVIEVFRYTRYPNACKALLTFLMEEEQYSAWLQASAGYFTHTLRAFENNPVWTEDPKRNVFRDATIRTLNMGYAGPLGYAAAGVLADFVIVDMVAQAATGQLTPAQAMRQAEKRANRYYRV